MARWRRTSAAALLALAALAASAPAEERALAFLRRGEPVTVMDLDALKRAASPGTVRVLEPYESGEAAFRALPFPQVLDAAYGPGWRDAEELLLRCADGYAPTVPVERVKRHRAWLAFERVDAKHFAIRKHESGERKTIELAPFYLVWENLDDEVVRQEADYGWPYQLVAVDLIRTRDRFGAMLPPDDAAPAARAGFAAFRIHCSRCHRLHGQGGTIGPELDPARIAARDRAWLRTWILDPSRIAPNARMEPLNPALPDRDRVVDEILAYLESLAPAAPR